MRQILVVAANQNQVDSNNLGAILNCVTDLTEDITGIGRGVPASFHKSAPISRDRFPVNRRVVPARTPAHRG